MKLSWYVDFPPHQYTHEIDARELELENFNI